MDVGKHLRFCPPGSPFFDMPARVNPDEGAFRQVHEDLPPGWTRGQDTEWVGVNPPDLVLPEQGWKIHVSATPENAQRVLDITWKYCVADGVAFKFLRGLPVLEHRNGKYGDRSASGKFITVYPLDEKHLERILGELGDLLDGEEGPYILSDLRWRSGPLYVRYGGFVLRTARTPSGETVHCITDPQGRLVPDHRGPGFRPPQWVTIPACLEEAVAARNAGTLEDFPYRVTGALHFSNGGGIYRGTDTRTGEEVLLREARPFAGLVEGRDALYRQRREYEALRRLAGLDCVPRLIDFRKGREHYFLVREYVRGEPLAKEMLRRNPLVRGSRSAEEYAEYAAWATTVLDHVERGVAAMHERGVVFGDLHPSNILVRPDGTVGFIDFETAGPPREATHQAMGAAGFTAPEGCTGEDIDRNALGCLRLAVFIPLTSLLPWGPRKAADLIDAVTARFPVPADYADRVLADLWSPPTPAGAGAAPSGSGDRRAGDPDAWPALRAAIGEGILACATPEREDRLFPGDPEQFFIPEGGVSLAHGAAGVLWSLAEAGVPVPEEHADWLVAATDRLDGPGPGCYDGLCGVALALDRLGRTETALEYLSRIDDAALEGADDSLLTGVPGIGLTLLHLARRTGDRGLLDRALRTACIVTDRAAGPDSPREGAPSRFGLLRGPAGGALLLLRLYEETGDTALLEHAETALRTDLARLGWVPDAPLPEDAPGRTPLLGMGCAGTGMVLHDLLRHRPDPELARARDTVRDLAGHHFIAQGGLFHGRAGTVLALGHLGAADGEGEEHARRLRRHAEDFALQTVRYEDRPAFLGHESLRISADLAGGGAGVLLALRAAHGEEGVGLPFFGGNGAGA
ncbi:phosphotransferase [Streptomyces sp. TRM43335]|uniref:non-specific serine/threonine protein kinase n=1 Tax=Streptomyces taklimakanensis TaxID=2569853 RepID=A0A6G2BHR8_9ACTN|nr:class III lanthionine synthetase LanKC [Streptomyces taklimakanensis]MTE21831.1 phosphotransferase [Streptomyces taklimakanensis]